MHLNLIMSEKNLKDELSLAVKAFDQNKSIACMILTGSQRAFAAG
jgi:enoyl-CoA hydratase/carnithine racemase